MEPLYAIRMTNISKSFGDAYALKDVSMQVRPGEVRALLGQNGSGKSTLIKALSGYYHPDQGTIEIGGSSLHRGVEAQRLGARFVHQDLALIDTESVSDNLALYSGYPTMLGTIRKSEMHKRAQAAMATVGLPGVSLASSVGALSPAERTGVAVARALMTSKDDAEQSAVCLVLDEPTATLADQEVAHLLEIVRRVADSGIAVLYVTHYLDEVFRVADSVSVLRDGRAVYTTAIEDARRPDIVRELVGEKFEERSRGFKARPASTVETPALELRDVHAGILKGINLKVASGEIVGIAGLIGSGREQVGRAAFGAFEISSGSVHVGGLVLNTASPREAIDNGVMYLPDDRKRFGASFDQTAQENFGILNLRRYWRRLGIDSSAEEKEAEHWFNELEVRPSGAARKPFRAFSGGNQQKILFAKWLSITPKVMLLDEPSQGVDIGAKATLHRHIDAAARRGCGVLVSSSDHDELASLCDRILIFDAGSVRTQLIGAEISAAAISHHCLHDETASS